MCLDFVLIINHTVDWLKPDKLVGMVETFDEYLMYIIYIYIHIYILCSDSMLVFTGIHGSLFRDLDGVIPLSSSSW